MFSIIVQMMWSKSTKVGCGFGKCAHKDAFIVTCQYQPSGNVIGMPMFSIDNYNKLIASGESMARCRYGTLTLCKELVR